MLSVLAFAMVATFMTLIMMKRLSAIVALILVPIIFAVVAAALVGGFGIGDLGSMMMDGVKELAPTGVMLVFAILYFGLMIDVGLFDPMIGSIVRLVHGDPVRVLVGTAVLALIVSLDGDGATTYMITTAAMLPLYRHLKMDVRMLACVVIMAGAVMNILPWGGPTARVMSALKLEAGEVFVPLIPAMGATALWVLFVAYRFGLKERARLARLPAEAIDEDASADEIIAEDSHSHVEARRPGLFWFNFALTAGLLMALILGAMPLAVLFMISFAIAITVNYPNLSQQRDRLAAHAGNALAVAGLVFAAGIFTGILSGTKMVDAMSASVIAAIPASWGPYMAPITAVISAPFTFFISNDAFYFGMLPILAEAGAHYGVTAAEIGRASLVGQQVHLLSPLVASTYLLVGFVGIEFGEHQKFTLKWAIGSFVVFFLVCLATAVFPFVA
ncbi:CitMHS family citrate-Mg2+:H+ or citrate-Ca2+:H+ symporter [Novosphingobium kunmingense]|uniref:CitMHS family citrate-Mg2+:H+ or citrate-Ca2+:H+ symporter n=1 Tax=Novosphingobium kunmingense TaxID=1211806 RepID=A0A2N0H3D4_9SPHN|nr:CitMHS family transporter [Novosphingobium kunmingense]PKB13452.1 CitMHS family citrate-Mg2+:H+ or citrate-Ca2+:H+ symporter [Novosphingobium kunmingense]